MGGLGNSLFQGFAGYLLEKKHHVYYVNNLTKSNFITNKLLKWTIHDDLFNRRIFVNQLNFSNLKTIIVLISIWLKRNKILVSNRNYLFEYQDNFSSTYTNYFGYFQSKDFILTRKHSFLKYCQFINQKLTQSLPEKQNFDLVVHYRWGDSDWAKENNKYYESVREFLISEYIDQKKLVITDDIKAAEYFFANIPKTKIEKNSVSEDFQLLCSSDIIFISPSTFSCIGLKKTGLGVLNIIV